MQGQGVDAGLAQCLGHLVAARPGAAEDQRGLGRLRTQQAHQRLGLETLLHSHPALRDVIGRRPTAVDLHRHRLTQRRLGDAPNRCRHGRRQQRYLALIGGIGQQPLHVLDEAHGQHLVGLVQNHQLDAFQAQRLALQQVDQPARRAHHDGRPALEPAQLRPVRSAAIDRQHLQPGTFAQLPQCVRHLQGQLAGRRQHQSPHRAIRRPFGHGRGDLHQHRQPVGRRLARACARPTDEVMSFQQRRDHSRLDRRRRLESERLQRLQQTLGQAQIGKCAGHGATTAPFHAGNAPIHFTSALPMAVGCVSWM